MVIKIQRPISTNSKQPTMLIYDYKQTILETPLVSDFEKACPGLMPAGCQKAYFNATFGKDDLLVIDKRTEDQNW